MRRSRILDGQHQRSRAKLRKRLDNPPPEPDAGLAEALELFRADRLRLARELPTRSLHPLLPQRGRPHHGPGLVARESRSSARSLTGRSDVQPAKLIRGGARPGPTKGPTSGVSHRVAMGCHVTVK
jgi:hypothetical protein